MNRRDLLRALLGGVALPGLAAPLRAATAPAAAAAGFRGVTFADVGRHAGLTAPTLFGSEHSNKYLLETTGCGVAFFDYDHDGWLDIFLVNGWRFEGFPSGVKPTNRLYHNNRDGTFTDVTERAGLLRSGWGQGCCIGDYDNDGYDDLFVTYWGQNVLYHNNGDGTFTDVTEKAGLRQDRRRWNTGCAFVDYNRDGHLDLFVANYIDFDPRTAPTPQSGPCLYKGLMVACGPPGLPGGKNILYRNNGDGTFTDVSVAAGITRAHGTYSLGVLTLDYDDDGWPAIYVADDSTPSLLYHNNRDGTFTDVALMAGCALSSDGKPQAGMGLAAADYDGDGRVDIFKTNFAGDTSSLYRNLGGGAFDDATFSAGVGVNTRFLGWGCGFVDLDNDSWPDIFITNGHVYPEVEKLASEAGYRQRKVVYRNLGDGRFADASHSLGPAVLARHAGRGCAFGDFDNDGDLDVVVNNVNEPPTLLRCDHAQPTRWIKFLLRGAGKSNRSAIGARVRIACGARRQLGEVRSGGSYISQSDLRLHFGLGAATAVDRVEIRWPSGATDSWRDLPSNRLYTIEEGKGIVARTPFPAVKGSAAATKRGE